MENIDLMYKILPAILVLGAIVFFYIFKNDSKKDQWVSTEDFQREKLKIKPYCSEEDFLAFLRFLYSYEGGYVRRRSGQIIYQDYLGKEKGDLKGIFYNVVIPNPNIATPTKEEYRRFLVGIGVTGVEKRPSYETRDSKLRNNKTDDEEFQRKEVGNQGEQVVRDILEKLDSSTYAVINGPVLKSNDVKKEYDHLVIGKTGVFSIETKAFGMSYGKPEKAALYINEGDKWIIRKNKNNRELVSPTEQVLAEQKHLESIISYPVPVHSILVLSNTELFVKNNIKLPYDIIKANELAEYIENYKDDLSDNDKMFILQDIDASRIN